MAVEVNASYSDLFYSELVPLTPFNSTNFFNARLTHSLCLASSRSFRKWCKNNIANGYKEEMDAEKGLLNGKFSFKVLPNGSLVKKK